MPVYSYQCQTCQNCMDIYRPVRDRNRSVNCRKEGCDGRAKRLFHTVNSTQQDYAQPVLSDSMGVNPDQVPEHRRNFPDVPITDDGRVICKSHHDKKRIMKILGFHDKDGYD